VFVLSPGSTKRNGEVFISAHPLYTLLSPFPSVLRFSLPISPSSSASPTITLPPFYIQIHSPASTPSSPAEDFDSCLIHVSHTVIPGYRNFLVAFSPRSVPLSRRGYIGAKCTEGVGRGLEGGGGGGELIFETKTSDPSDLRLNDTREA